MVLGFRVATRSGARICCRAPHSLRDGDVFFCGFFSF
jgi:hypothetical protein